MRLDDLFDQELTFANFLFGAGLIIGPIILAATAITVVAGVIRIIVMPMVAHGGMTRAEQTGRGRQAKTLARLLFGLGLILAAVTAADLTRGLRPYRSLRLRWPRGFIGWRGWRSEPLQGRIQAIGRVTSARQSPAMRRTGHYPPPDVGFCVASILRA
jgi:hypothetical protein